MVVKMVQKEVPQSQLTPLQEKLDDIAKVLRKFKPLENVRPAGDALNKVSKILGDAYEEGEGGGLKGGYSKADVARAWFLAGEANRALGNNADAWHCYSAAKINADPNDLALTTRNFEIYKNAPDSILPKLPGGRAPEPKNMLDDSYGLPGIRGRPDMVVEKLALEHVEAEKVGAVGELPAVAALELRRACIDGRLLLVQNKFDEALGEFRSIRGRMSDMREPERYNYGNYYAKALIEKAKTASDAEKKTLLEEARKLGENLSKMKGNEAQGHHIMAVALALAGKYDKSVVHAQQAYNGSKDDKKLHAVAAGQLAYSLTRQATTGGKLADDQQDKINKLHEKACKTFDNNAILWHNRSVFEAKHGKKEDATKYATNAVSRLGIKPMEPGGLYYSINEIETIQKNFKIITGQSAPAAPAPSPLAPLEAVGPAVAAPVTSESPVIPGLRPPETHEGPAAPTPPAAEKKAEEKKVEKPAETQTPPEMERRGKKMLWKVSRRGDTLGSEDQVRDLSRDDLLIEALEKCGGEWSKLKQELNNLAGRVVETDKEKTEVMRKFYREAAANLTSSVTQNRINEVIKGREKQARLAREGEFMRGLTGRYGAENFKCKDDVVPENFEKASEHFDRMIHSGVEPSIFFGHLGRGLIRVQQGDVSGAVHDLTSVLENLPKEKDWRKNGDNTAFLNAEVECLLALGDISQKQKITREAVHKDYGVRIFGRYREAMDFYDAAAERVEDENLAWGRSNVDEFQTRAFMGRGSVHETKGRWAEAGEEYAKALRVNGENRDALDGLRRSAEKTGNHWLVGVCDGHKKDDTAFSYVEFEKSKTQEVSIFNKNVAEYARKREDTDSTRYYRELLMELYKNGVLKGDRVVGQHIVDGYENLAACAKEDSDFEKTFSRMERTLSLDIFGNDAELQSALALQTAATGLKWAKIREDAYKKAGDKNRHRAESKYDTLARKINALCEELHLNYHDVMRKISSGMTVEQIRENVNQKL